MPKVSTIGIVSAGRYAGSMTGMDESRRAFEAMQHKRANLEKYRERFIGLTADDARRLADELEIDLRIIDLDAVEWHPPDLRYDRLTLDVKDGRVAGASVA